MCFFKGCLVVSILLRPNDNTTTVLILHWWEKSECRPIRFLPWWIFCINTNMFNSNKKRVWLGLPLDAVGQWKSWRPGSASWGLVEAWLVADIKAGRWLLTAGVNFNTQSHLTLPSRLMPAKSDLLVTPAQIKHTG